MYEARCLYKTRADDNEQYILYPVIYYIHTSLRYCTFFRTNARLPRSSK